MRAVPRVFQDKNICISCVVNRLCQVTPVKSASCIAVNNQDAAAEEAFRLLPANGPKYIVSESIGTGVACDLAQDHPTEIAGMALLVPYHNLASVAQHKMWFLPAYIFLLDRFNPEKSLKSYHGPVKFVIAGSDEIIGPATGIRLFKRYAGPKDLQIIAGAHHNEVAEQLPDWWQKVFSFWKENQTVEPGTS